MNTAYTDQGKKIITLNHSIYLHLCTEKINKYIKSVKYLRANIIYKEDLFMIEQYGYQWIIKGRIC